MTKSNSSKKGNRPKTKDRDDIDRSNIGDSKSKHCKGKVKFDRKQKDYKSKEENEFLVLLSSLSLKVKYIDGDGNCLFRSIADQLLGNPEQHGTIREKIVTYISDNKDHFSLFIEDDEKIEDYLVRMR